MVRCLLLSNNGKKYQNCVDCALHIYTLDGHSLYILVGAGQFWPKVYIWLIIRFIFGMWNIPGVLGCETVDGVLGVLSSNQLNIATFSFVAFNKLGIFSLSFI